MGRSAAVLGLCAVLLLTLVVWTSRGAESAINLPNASPVASPEGDRVSALETRVASLEAQVAALQTRVAIPTPASATAVPTIDPDTPIFSYEGDESDMGTDAPKFTLEVGTYEVDYTCDAGDSLLLFTAKPPIEEATFEPGLTQISIDVARPEVGLISLCPGDWTVDVYWAAPSASVGDTSEATESAELHDIQFSLTIFGSENILYAGIGRPCSGKGGYDDLGPGLSVTLFDGEGNVIGTAFAEESELVARGECVISAVIENVPEVPFYQVEAGRRGAPSYSLKDMQEMNWEISLEIGR